MVSTNCKESYGGRIRRFAVDVLHRDLQPCNVPHFFNPAHTKCDSGDELVSGAIKDKAAKIAFLDKLVALVGICSGYDIPVRPSKVVAGLEPEGTNALLAVRRASHFFVLQTMELVPPPAVNVR